MNWAILWTAPAAKDLGRLDTENAGRVKRAVERLATTGHGDVKRLQGRMEWRLRVGDWRVLLRLDHPGRTLHVLRVRHRGDAYRR